MKTETSNRISDVTTEVQRDRKTLNAELGIEGTRIKVPYLPTGPIHQKLGNGDSRILVVSNVQSIMFTLETANA
ncbi:hypothetical protein Celaphus_00002774, partial [Cervus elaphus hippelaphus]